MKFEVLYKDGTTAVIETDETKERLEQHAHIATAVQVHDITPATPIANEPEVTEGVIVEEPVVEEITEVVPQVNVIDHA